MTPPDRWREAAREKPKKCPTCGSNDPLSFEIRLSNLRWECPNKFHQVAPASTESERQKEERDGK